MNYRLSYSKVNEVPKIALPLSKSISNRVLIARELSGSSFDIEQLSDSDDTRILLRALKSDKVNVDVGMAGTAYRFLTAYYALKGDPKILTGAKRMSKRPIKDLVDVLVKMGADIDYIGEHGFPPIRIHGKELNGGQYDIKSSISSQFISAVLLIAPYLQRDIQLSLVGEMVSSPYIDVTINVMKELNVNVTRIGNTIEVKKGRYNYSDSFSIESDWSSAAFFYQLVAMGVEELFIEGLVENSFQGDKNLTTIYKSFGVESEFVKGGITLRRNSKLELSSEEFEMRAYPDLVPSIIVSSAILIDETIIKGIKSLRIKESDRIQALQMELKKIGSNVELINEDTIKVTRGNLKSKAYQFDTHNDHRIAMCLAPLAMQYDFIKIDGVDVVSKSFPRFWEEMSKAGITAVSPDQ